MRFILPILVTAALGLAAPQATDATSAEYSWLTDLGEATQLAEDSDRPLLAAFR